MFVFCKNKNLKNAFFSLQEFFIITNNIKKREKEYIFELQKEIKEIAVSKEFSYRYKMINTVHYIHIYLFIFSSRYNYL